MKRFLATMLALLMALAMATTASAESAAYPDYLNLDSQAPIIKDGSVGTVIPKMMIVQDSTGGKWEDLWISRFLKDKYNIEFEVESVLNTALADRKSLMFATEDLPDIMAGFGLSPAEILRNGQQEQMLLALDTVISEKLTPNIYNYFQMKEVRAAATTPDGHVYTLPTIVSKMDEGAYPRIFLNTVELDALGVENPKTLDAFVEMLYAFKKAKGEEAFPIGGGIDTVGVGYYFMNALGYITTDNYGKTVALRNGEVVIPAYDMEVFKEYLTLMNAFYKDGIINQNYFTLENTEAIAQLNNGQTLMYGTPVYVTGLASWSDWTAVYPLTSNWNETQQWPSPTFVRVGNFAISASSECPELCLRYADIYYAEDSRDLWTGPGAASEYNYGYVNAEYDAATNAAYWDNEALPEGVDLWTYLMQYTAGFMPSWGAIEDDPAYSYWFVKNGGTYDAYNKTFDMTQPDPQYRASVYTNLVPFGVATFPTIFYTDDDTNDQIIDLKTLIDPYIEQQVALFITGERSLDETDAFVGELQSMGIEDLLALYRQIYESIGG